jgi:hypothetical protein
MKMQARTSMEEKKLLAAVGLRFFSRYVVEIGLNSSLVSARWRIKMIFMAQSGSSFQFFDCTPAPSLVAICSLGTITSAIILNLAAYAMRLMCVCKRASFYFTFIFCDVYKEWRILILCDTPPHYSHACDARKSKRLALAHFFFAPERHLRIFYVRVLGFSRGVPHWARGALCCCPVKAD